MSETYKVITMSADEKHNTELGEFATLEEAMDCTNNWALARRAEGKEREQESSPVDYERQGDE